MDAILLDEITSAVREADDWFKKIGGSSRHWVDDCFLPMLKKRGIDIFKAQEVYDCESRLSAVEAELEAERTKHRNTLGVGDGSGNLFVHGDYESIKAAQKIIFERERLQARVTELEAEIKNWKGKYDSLLEDFNGRLKPIYDYVDGMAVSVAEDEIDRLQQRNAEFGNSLDRMMQDNSELTVKVHQLEDEIGKLRFALEFIGGLGDHAKPGEVERLVNAVLREVDCE